MVQYYDMSIVLSETNTVKVTWNFLIDRKWNIFSKTSHKYSEKNLLFLKYPKKIIKFMKEGILDDINSR